MEYSIYGAIAAGFDKVVFIIRKDIEKAFREIIGDRISTQIEVEYVYQELDALWIFIPIETAYSFIALSNADLKNLSDEELEAKLSEYKAQAEKYAELERQAFAKEEADLINEANQMIFATNKSLEDLKDILGE